MSKLIDSRKTSISHSTSEVTPNSRFSPNRLGAIAALSVLTAVGAASQIDISSDTSRDIVPAVSTIDSSFDDATEDPSTLEPGSIMAVKEAHEIADITNPNNDEREASVAEARELTGFQP